MDTIKAPDTTNDVLNPKRTLYCACCGARTRGRQWWNQDNGYGICAKCVNWIKNRERNFGTNPDDAEIERLYGVRGVHWDC